MLNVGGWTLGCMRMSLSGIVCVFLAFAPSRSRGLSRRLLPVALRMNAELVPVRLGKVHVVVPRRLLNIREGELSIGVRYIDDLIESRHSVAHVLSVSQRFFPLMRKGKDTVRQVAARGEPPMLFVRLPGGHDVRHLTLLLSGSAQCVSRGPAGRQLIRVEV